MVFVRKAQSLLPRLALAALPLATAAHAQIPGSGATSAPTIGGTLGAPPPPVNPFAASGSYLPIQKGPTGLPCIKVDAFAKPQTINKAIIDHQVIVTNSCGKTIKVRVCYHKKTDCIVVVTNGYSRLQRTLGISAGESDFRYEFRELY
jgi:hypothetical protein